MLVTISRRAKLELGRRTGMELSCGAIIEFSREAAGEVSRGRKPPERGNVPPTKAPERRKRRASVAVTPTRALMTRLRRRPITLAFSLLLLTGPLWTTPAFSQQPTDRVAALLAKLPAENAPQITDLQRELGELSPADIGKLCDLLVEPGTGDDTKPRMVVHALAFYCGGPGRAADCQTFTAAVCAALKTDKPASLKSFLIEQLKLASGPDAVPALAPLLTDEKLGDFAAQALLSIAQMGMWEGGKVGKENDSVVQKVAAAFRTALPKAEGRNRIAIIDALGLLRDREAEDELNDQAKRGDDVTRFAAASALANFGSPGNTSAKPLPEATWYDYCQAIALNFKLAAHAPAPNARDMEVFYSKFLSRPPATEREVHLRCAALYGLAQLKGAAAIEAVVQAMTGDEPELRGAATEIAASLAGEGVTAALLKQLDKAPPTARAAIIGVLERRGDEAALPDVIKALHDDDKTVRLAAVPAAAALGKMNALPALVIFVNTPDVDEQKAARQALVRARGDGVAAFLSKCIDGAPTNVRVALLNVLADRRAHEQLPVILTQTGVADAAVRIAAIDALGVLGDETVVPRLIALLSNASATDERAALERALAADCNRTKDKAQRAAPILAGLQSDRLNDYCSLLRVLGHVGGDAAFQAVQKAVADEREDVRDAAFRALGDWPDGSIAERVLELAVQTPALQLHVLGMRAFARLVALDKHRPPADALRMYAAGLKAVRRPDETKLMLSKAGEVKDVAALALLEVYLADKDVCSEAAAALVSAADNVLPGGWAAAADALGKVENTAAAGTLKDRIAEVRQRVAECEDFVTDWLVAGPYSEAGKTGQQVFDRVFPPEEPRAREVKWAPQPTGTNPDEFWRIDLNANAGIAGDNRAAYLLTHVYSPTAQEAQLECGSDDGIKIWLNDAVVHANNALRGCERGQDKVTVALKEGWNALLLKVTNDGGAWAATVRIRAPGGGRLKGIRIQAELPP